MAVPEQKVLEVLSTLTSGVPCPSCGKQSRKAGIDNEANSSCIMSMEGNLLPTYTFICQSCGFVSQFLKHFIDEKIKKDGIS